MLVTTKVQSNLCTTNTLEMTIWPLLKVFVVQRHLYAIKIENWTQKSRSLWADGLYSEIQG